MPSFQCKIGLPDGRVVEKEIDAFSRDALRDSLEAQGMHVFSIRKRLSASWLGLGSGGRWSGRQFLAFNQEFLVLLSSGLPILDVLDTVSEQMESRAVRGVLQEIRQEVKGGATLSEAFGKFPRYFPALFVASLRSGERSGDLPVTIGRYIAYQQRTERIKSKVRNASFYPMFLLFAATLVLFFLLLYVIPTFSQIYADARVELPFLTRVLIGFANLLKDHFVLLLVALVIVVFGVRKALGTPRGREWFDRGKLEIPFLKHLFRDYALTGFCRTLATTLSSGIPVIPALGMAGGVINNQILRRRTSLSIKRVEEGMRLSQALDEAGFFPPVALRMIGVGEKSGALSEMLEDVAVYYEQELERRLDRLTTLVEPLMMAFIGLVIGVLVVAMYVPIFQLAGTVR
ncbi:MAG: type II secretion system F family protein [Syntrophotaleaceae bacterium]